VKRRHHVQPALRGDAHGFLARFLEVLPVFDQRTPSARIATFFSMLLPWGT
jgi:hypothetical protein